MCFTLPAISEACIDRLLFHLSIPPRSSILLGSPMWCPIWRPWRAMPNISPWKPTHINCRWRFASNDWVVSFRGEKKKGWLCEQARRKSGCVRGRENTRIPQPSEKRERKWGDFCQIGDRWPVCLQASVGRFKHAWIGSKLGKLVPYLDYFDLASWFDIWVTWASMRAVLSVQTALISAHSNFGRRTF